jgi:hypothetical protein
MWKKILYRHGFFSMAIPLVAWVLAFQTGAAQDRLHDLFANKENVAARHFAEKNYPEALRAYKKIFLKHPERIDISNKMGRCYYELRQPEKAVEFFELAKEKSALDDVSQRYYFLSLNETGRHTEAYELLKMDPPVDVPMLSQSRFRIIPTMLNSQYSEYPVGFYGDGILFISNRTLEKPVKRTVAATKSGLEKLFFSRFGEDGSLIKPVPFAIENLHLPANIHHGSVIFFNDGRLLRQDDGQEDEKNDRGHCGSKAGEETANSMVLVQSIRKAGSKKALPGLFLARKTDAGWAIADTLFIQLQGSFSQPFVDEGAGRLYFISDTPGGHGGTDIYYSEIGSSGFSVIINAGPALNTPGNEMFPFVSNGYLYFSSNGHPGLGGLDLFRAAIEENGFGDLENLGPGINSERDDYAIVFDRHGKRGFFSSNRGDNPGSDGIYHFYMLQTGGGDDTVLKGP